MRRALRLGSAPALIGLVAAVLAGCGGGGSSGGSPASGSINGGSINVAVVDNPQMKDIASLTPKLFTAKTHIKVHYTVLDEGTLRQVTTRDVAAGGRQFDVVMIGPYEAPQFGKDGTLVDLTPLAKADTSYAYSDLIPSVRDALS
jgi:sorbitol/mannitol transport system substrate-binding protein